MLRRNRVSSLTRNYCFWSRRTRPPNRAALRARTLLSFDRKGAEFRVLIADLAKRNVIGIGAPRLDLIHTVPNLHNQTLRTLATEHNRGLCASCSGSPDGDEAATGRLDHGLSLGRVLFC